MTIEELIDKFRFALTFLGITGGESMTIALNRESLEQVIAILEEYRQMKGEQK